MERSGGRAWAKRWPRVWNRKKGWFVYRAARPKPRLPGGAPPRGESPRETRLIDEVSNVIESVMKGIEDAHRRQVPVRDIEVSLSRAMLAFQRRNYRKAIKIALACDSDLKERLRQAPPAPPTATPPRPPLVAR